MDKIQELKETMHKEKDVKVHTKMIAVLGVLCGNSTQNMANSVDVTQRTVQLWMKRFNKYGVDGLRDLPGRGKRPDVKYKQIKTIANNLEKKNGLTPRALRDHVHKRKGKQYSLCNIRKIMKTL